MVARLGALARLDKTDAGQRAFGQDRMWSVRKAGALPDASCWEG